MKNRTPQKKNTNSESIRASPVTFLRSPHVASSPTNLTGTVRVAADIVANVYNNIQIWNDFHIQGVEICKQIFNLKLTSQEKYPDGLEELCFNLDDIVIELEKIIEILKSLHSQMCALNKQCTILTKLFRIATMDQVAEMVTTIVEAYKKEYLMKEYVKRKVAQVELNNVSFLTYCWLYQSNITNIDIKLDALLIEVGHKV